MITRFTALWRGASPGLRRRLVVIYSFLITLNVVTWAVTLVVANRYPGVLGSGKSAGTLIALAVLAYGFGLRHAVDPDHIAAIDNTTRKLMQDGKKPVGVGLFFSLGHSTVVFALSLLVAVSAGYVHQHLDNWKSVGSVIGTSVSGFFLVIIATINLIVFVDIYRTWTKVVRGGTYDDKTLDDYLSNRGLIARLLKPMLRVVNNSWNMYPIGLLFGLGFDTASEVGLLGITATTASGAHAMPSYFILLLPLLFVAGMSLADTTDGVAMLGAYGWAFVKPVRKLYYNMSITGISIVVALLIGGLELMQVLITETKASGGVWDVLGGLDISNMGFVIVGVFLVSWLGSVAYYRLRKLDELDEQLTKASPGVGVGLGR